MNRGYLFFGLFAAAILTGTAEVMVWPAAPGTTTTNAFAVSVNGRAVDVMEIPKSAYYGEDRAFPYYYAMFDADESVKIEIRAPWSLKRAKLLPLRNGATQVTATDERLSFRAKPPFTLVVEPFESRHRALVLTANLPETDVPDANDPNVVFISPGRHHLDKPLTIGDGQTLYLAPGAWLESAVLAKGREVTIRGRGVISGIPWAHKQGPTHDMVRLSGRNVAIRDVTLVGSWFYTLVLLHVDGALVDGVKVLGGRCNNDDGIDPIWAKNVTIRNCFVRTHDDCIAPKDSIENLTVENCALWADGANNIRIGYECAGGPAKPFRNVRFRDIDILHQSMKNDVPPDAYWVEAAIHLQPSNGMTFEDFVFEDFHFAFTPQAQDLLLEVRTHPCQNGPQNRHKEGGHVRNLTFRNFTLPARRPLGALGIWLQSVDSRHIISDVAFENMKNFEVPVGIRGKVENVRGLPDSLVRDERESYCDYDSWHKSSVKRRE